MAAINYTGIQDAIEAILKADVRTNAARVFVEEEPEFGLMDAQQVIAVYLEERVTPEKSEYIALGKKVRLHLKIPIWVAAFSTETYRRACELRNSLLGNLELVLMDNATLSGTVESSWLNGGAIISAKSAQSGIWMAGAETILIADVTASSL